MRQSPDRLLLAVVIILAALGIVMAYSTGIGRDQGAALFRGHLAKGLVGTVGMVIAYKVGYRRWSAWAKKLLLPVNISLMGLLALKMINGGICRWYRLGPFSFQPSEVAKLILVLYMADFLARKGEHVREFKRGVLPALIACGVPLVLILAEPDLSTTVAVGGILGGMLFVGGVRIKHLAGIGLVIAMALGIVVLGLGHGRERVLAYLGKGDEASRYQMEQSLVALGAGGVFGRGLGMGVQKHWFLPESHTDFVFSVVGEELGLVGTLGVLGLFALYGWRGMSIARRVGEVRGFLVAVGITLMVEVYALSNIAVATGILPTTGLPLPFVSYGGTSLVVSLAGSGILLDVSRGER